jgi:hypothetical protein
MINFILATLLPVLQVEVTSTSLLILGMVSVAAGVLIFLVPRILNYLVAAYLVIIGIIWILAAL